LMTSGRSQMVTTGNCGNWHTVVGEICWSPMPETSPEAEKQPATPSNFAGAGDDNDDDDDAPKSGLGSMLRAAIGLKGR